MVLLIEEMSDFVLSLIELNNFHIVDVWNTVYIIENKHNFHLRMEKRIYFTFYAFLNDIKFSTSLPIICSTIDYLKTSLI